jgi:hypothetical protein
MSAESNSLPMLNMGQLAKQNNKRALQQDAAETAAAADDKPTKKAPKRSLAATIERMEKHKFLERKRREKTKQLVSELQGLIPSVETVPEGLTMNTVLEEAIEHLKAQHSKQQDGAVVVRKAGSTDGSVDADGEDKGESAGAGGLAGAFGRSATGTIDVFNLIQNQIDDIGALGPSAAAQENVSPGAAAAAAGGQSTMTLALEKKSATSTDQLQLGRMPDQEFKYFRLVLMQETLYAKMLEGWEKRMGVELVRDSLSMLRIARQGLSQQELEEILQIHEKVITAILVVLTQLQIQTLKVVVLKSCKTSGAGNLVEGTCRGPTC